MTRVAFRFSVVYLTLYCLATQIVGGLLLFPGFSFPGFGTYWPMRAITQWVARILGVTSPLITTGNSGDTAFYWVQTFWLLVVSAIVTLAWSDLDRQRADYSTLRKWFRLFIRFALAAQMFDYGMAKVIPTQFPAPSLVTLLEPIGHLSLTDVLWVSIGAATPYQLFTGCAEMLAGILLIVPGTTLAGALICLADMTQVFVLNMAYDFGLKQISFHLILMALFLVAPDLSSLTNLFFLNRPAAPSNDPPLFAHSAGQSLGARRAAGVRALSHRNVHENQRRATGMAPEAVAFRSRRSTASGKCSNSASTAPCARRIRTTTTAAGGASSSTRQTRWRSSARTNPSPTTAPPSTPERRRSRSRRATARVGTRTSRTNARHPIVWCSMARWTASQSTWSCSVWTSTDSGC